MASLRLHSSASPLSELDSFSPSVQCQFSDVGDMSTTPLAYSCASIDVGARSVH